MKKSFFVLLLTLGMLVNTLPLTVAATTVGTPTNLRWDGYVCKWDTVVGATSYHVTLCCAEEASVSGNPKIVASYTSKAEIDLSSNFNYESSIKYRQNYYFIVRAIVGETYGDPATSSKLFYHRHDWQWNADETHHWKECANTGCDITDKSLMPEYGEHSFSGHTCTTCNYAEHLHSFSTSYTYNNDYHWRSATCGHSEKLEYETHTYRNNNCFCGAHRHVSRAEWRYDKFYHWHECSADKCPADSVSDLEGYATHSFVNGSCVCGYATPVYVSNATATVQKPLAGSEPIYSIVSAEPDKYTATLVYWLDESMNKMSDRAVFQSGKTYYVMVRFSAVLGYEINANTKCSITDFTSYSYDVFKYQIPENAQTHSHSWKNEWSYDSWYHWKECKNSLCEGIEIHNKEGYGKHDFSGGNCICGKKKPIILSSVNVNITEPVVDATPDFNLTVSGENYTAEFVSWYDNNLYLTMTQQDHFCSGNEYTARVRFIPDEGYGFDSNTVFTINGKETWHYSAVGPDWRYICFSDIPSYPMTVSFDGNGHGSGFEKQNLYRGDTVLRPEVQTDGYYRLAGWYREKECINEWDFSVDVVEENTTLYAKWVDTRIPSINFTLNGYKADANITSAGVTINTNGIEFTTHNDIIKHTFRLLDSNVNLTSGTFDGNKEYTVTAIVRIKDGYTKAFTQNSIKLNGWIEPSYYRYYSGYYIIEFELPKLKNSAVNSVEVLDIDAPVAGQTPDYYASLGNPFWYELANYGPYGTGFWWYDSEGTPMTAEDKFVAGETYSLEIKLSQKKDGNAIMTSFQTPVAAYLNGQMVSSLDVTANTTTIYVFATFECEAAPAVTVSGTVTSFGSDTDDVTIELYREGQAAPAYTVTVKGNVANYSIADVSAGVYTMKVSKASHVVREYTITVEDENITKDAKINLKGDVTSDGVVDSTDYIRVKMHFLGTYTLTDVALKAGDVTEDGTIDSTDYLRIKMHFLGTYNLHA